ncbi:efflux RND transporter periplasmic adaptor subunit [Pseudanabaena sp. ABRG5-3]|uniref:efflux RND transporter periplasmic adaptor subunit n=1 Tax=Pseudanabaena sp. ABRG5-3 TaxID=685565 RepID=UPI000DC6F97D|nr:efflux RND transporter periplasmic adaptor subunit [Pseudanabaena sp. ABRG5-3]BBC26722.1 efflux transporter, RND family, MFP subunit [Pseudanabaena sp. ABRG5-3]
MRISPRLRAPILKVLLSLILLSNPAIALAHAGHGDEFKGTNTTEITGISVDDDVAKSLGIKVETVKIQPLKFGMQTTGQIETLPNQQVKVTTPIKGTIVNLLVEPGALVQAGQPVAILSSPELADLRVGALEKQAEASGNILNAESNLRLARQNLERQKLLVEADIRQAQTELNLDKERYERDKELLEKGAIARRQLQESEAKFAAARAALTKAESRLPLLEAQAQLERAEADVQVSSVKVDLSTATYSARLNQLEASANSNGTITIAAPIDGVVSDREATVGESVEEAGKPLMTIVNDERVLASANIYEKDISKIRIGQPVQVKIAGQPSTTVFQGKVTVIGSTVEGQSRIVPVKAEIGNVKGQLKAGMFTNIEILTDSVSMPILAIPTASVIEANGKQLVFVQNGKSYQPVDVTLGRTSGDLVEVTSGLFEGDRIVTQRANQLYAQSLRGDNKPKDDHSNAIKPDVSIQNNWWLMLLVGGVGGGAIVAIAFWLGRRSGTKMVILREPSTTSDRIDR